MKIVIAGNYAEFAKWCRDNSVHRSKAIYADSNERLMGVELSEDDIVYTGQYWLSPVDLDLLESRTRTRAVAKHIKEETK